MTAYFYNVTVEVGTEHKETSISNGVEITGSTLEYETRVLHGLIETSNNLSLGEEIERLAVARMEMEEGSVMDITINIITCLG